MRAATAAFALLLAGSATAQFGGVTPPRIPGSFENLPCPSVSQLPLRTNPITTNADSTVTISVEAWCNGRPIAGLAEQAQCGAANAFVVLDDGDEVSDLEAEIRVEVEPGVAQTLILIDLSNSIAQQLNLEGATKAAVVTLIQRLFAQQSQAGVPVIAVYAFDGRRTSQRVHDWSSDQTSLVNSINAMKCGQTTSSGALLCGDTSTNLYGILAWAAGHLKNRLTVQANGRNTARGRDGALVVFTDGNDLAHIGTAAAARQAIVDAGIIVFAIGVYVNEQTRQQQLNNLIAITGDSQASFLGESLTALPGLAQNLGELLSLFYSRAYKITYCSPRRKGLHTLDVRIRYQNQVGPVMGFITGETVGYLNPTTQATDTVSVTQVIAPTANSGQPITYRITFPNNASPAIIVQGTSLRHLYDANSFVAEPKCALHNQILGIRTQPCQVAQGGDLSAFTCTGGSEYECASRTCKCPLQVTTNAQCNPADCRAVTQQYQAPLYVQKTCPNGLPQAPITIQAGDFKVLGDSTLSMIFRPVCQDGSNVGGLTFSPCSDLSSLKLYETDAMNVYQPVSLYESRPRITCVPQPAHVISLMLLDMSDSILRGYGALERMKNLAVAYIDGLTKDINSHTVAVYTFDGTPNIRLLGDFASTTTAKNAIAGLTCGSDRCRDHSTNLNGAIMAGSDLLRTYHAANAKAPDGVSRQPFLVLLTDGADQAQYFTDAQAIAKARGQGVFAIGLMGEIRSNQLGASDRGSDVARLQALAPSGLFITSDPTGLRDAFQKVGSAISSAAAKSYRLDYCSPRRVGTHRFKLELTQGSSVTYWEQQFDASAQFQCSGGACNNCLGGAASLKEFTCSSQPTQANQNFACENNAVPVSHNGYCRCPCANAAQYPPATYVGPGPIICEPQGTCAKGERVSCSTHGRLPVQSTPAPFIKFGSNSNSRVSMEFVPKCADDWPMPRLRMSVCDSLSDFRVYENGQLVSKYESEPRVVCYDDVTSIILIDTSGSVRLGGGLAAIRSALKTYINEMAARLQVKHNVAIYAFDGKEKIQPITKFQSNIATLRTTIDNWNCGQNDFELGQVYCSDPSTNLYGAIEQVVAIVESEVQGSDAIPYLVVFSDGTDQAGRRTEAQAVAAVARGATSIKLTTYAIGLVGEMNDGRMGLDAASLARLAPGGQFVAQNTGVLGVEFGKVAQQIIDQTATQESTTYRIDYCSPARAGMTNVRVELLHEGQTYSWAGNFDANSFQCEGNACGNCLSKRQYSCTNQPAAGIAGGDQQAFTCDVSEPLVHNQQCKCPCQGTYPPDATPAPPTANTPTPGTPSSNAPIITPGTGTYPSAIVQMTYSRNPQAQIYYTIDNTNPSASSTLYSTPIAWNQAGATRFAAVATVNGQPVSDVAYSTITIGNAPPTNGDCTSLSVSGYQRLTNLNQVYTRDTSRPVAGQPTYWSADGNYFYYYCASSVELSTGNQWRIAQSKNYEGVRPTTAGIKPACNSVARSKTPGSTLYIANGAQWEERLPTETPFTAATIAYSCNGVVATPPPFTNPPVGTPSAVVAINPVAAPLGQQSIANVFTGIAPTAGGTSVSATCQPTNTALFTPMSNGVLVALTVLANGLSTMSFNALQIGTTQVACTFRDSLGRTRVLTTVLNIGGANNGLAPIATTSIPTVTAPLGLQSVSGVFTGIAPSTGATTVTATCLPVNAALFTPLTTGVTVALDMIAGGSSTMRFNGLTAGTTQVSCTFTDNLSRTSVFPINLILTGSTTPSNKGMYRLGLRLPLSQFRQLTFKQIVERILNGMGLTTRINWVCRERACFQNDLCPVAGPDCLIGSQVPSRAGEVLQDDGVIYVDFDTYQTGTGLPATIQQRNDALARLNADINNCNDNDPCSFTTSGWNPSHEAVNVNPNGVTAMDDLDDDSGLKGWEIALIVLGCVLCCCLLLLLLFLLTRSKKDKTVHETVQESPREAKTTEYYDDTYDQSRSYYDDTYYTQSYYETENYQVGDAVKALYVDGEWYEASIFNVMPDGTYEVKWADGQHSEGIPADQLQRAE